MNQIFKQKTVVVTGASQGIGLAIAKLYADNQANIVIADTKTEKGG